MAAGGLSAWSQSYLRFVGHVGDTISKPCALHVRTTGRREARVRRFPFLVAHNHQHHGHLVSVGFTPRQQKRPAGYPAGRPAASPRIVPDDYLLRFVSAVPAWFTGPRQFLAGLHPRITLLDSFRDCRAVLIAAPPGRLRGLGPISDGGVRRCKPGSEYERMASRRVVGLGSGVASRPRSRRPPDCVKYIVTRGWNRRDGRRTLTPRNLGQTTEKRADSRVFGPPRGS